MATYQYLSFPFAAFEGERRDEADVFVDLMEATALRYDRTLVVRRRGTDSYLLTHAALLVAVPVAASAECLADIRTAAEADVPVFLLWPKEAPIPRSLRQLPQVVEVRVWGRLAEALTAYRDVLRLLRLEEADPARYLH